MTVASNVNPGQKMSMTKQFLWKAAPQKFWVWNCGLKFFHGKVERKIGDMSSTMRIDVWNDDDDDHGDRQADEEEGCKADETHGSLQQAAISSGENGAAQKAKGQGSCASWAAICFLQAANKLHLHFLVISVVRHQTSDILYVGNPQVPTYQGVAKVWVPWLGEHLCCEAIASWVLATCSHRISEYPKVFLDRDLIVKRVWNIEAFVKKTRSVTRKANDFSLMDFLRCSLFFGTMSGLTSPYKMGTY